MSPAKTVAVLVEDDRDLNESIADYLDVRGHEVSAHLSGQKALAALERLRSEGRASQVQFIISDWMMRDGDGPWLLKECRNGAFRDTPFILMSGAMSMDELARARGEDVDAVLVKPFELDALDACVEEAARRREQKILARSLTL